MKVSWGILYTLLLSLEASKAIQYRQSKDLLASGRLRLGWTVSEGRIYLKVTAKGSKSVTLLFSYNDVPTDGFNAGLDHNSTFFFNDLHLDFAGRNEALENFYVKSFLNFRIHLKS